MKFGVCPLGSSTLGRTDIFVLNQHASWIPVRPQSPVTMFQFLEDFDIRVRIVPYLCPSHSPESISVPKAVILTFPSEGVVLNLSLGDCG